MARRAVVDTNVWFAWRSERDTFNERATAIVDALENGVLPTACVPDTVLLETMNALVSKRRHDVAVETYTALEQSSDVQLVRTRRSDHDRARELFVETPISLGDARIAAFMERAGVEYLYSFDADFDRFDWVTRLTTVEEPFGPG